MGSKLKKIALPLAAIGLMAATGGAAAPAVGVGGSAGGVAAAKAAAAAQAAAAKTAAAGSGVGAKLFGTAAKTALSKAAPLTMGKGIGSARAMGLLKAGTTTIPGTAGFLGTAGSFAPLKGTLARGIMANLANPLSLKGAATYGALGMAGKGLMGDKQKKLDTSKDDDAAQAAYDYHMMMSKGIMSPEDARKSFATYGKGMKGDYTPGTEMGTGRYEELYPALNYSGLTRYNPNPIPGPAIDKEKLREYNPYVFAADGGMIDPLEEMPIITPMETEEERRMREAMEQIKMLQAKGFDFSQGNPVPDPYAEEPMTSMNYQGRADGGRIGFDMGGYASFKDVIEQFAESLSPDEFDAFIEMDRDQQIKIMTNAGVLRDDYAVGGSVPQTKSIPQGMQLDGRGGGFIPMGAKEKHDDVPAMLAKNEFVMTSDAVKAAGGGSVNKGAQVMYDLMNSLESKV